MISSKEQFYNLLKAINEKVAICIERKHKNKDKSSKEHDYKIGGILVGIFMLSSIGIFMLSSMRRIC